jgi:SHOCT-like domain
VNKETIMQQTFPAGTAQDIAISNIGGNLFIGGHDQQTIIVETRHALTHLQPEGDTLYIDGCEDTLKIFAPFETQIRVTNVAGSVQAENVRQTEVGIIEGNASLTRVTHVELERVRGNLELNVVENASIGRIDGDARVKGGIASLRGDSVEGNCHMVGNGNAEIVWGHIGGDAVVVGAVLFQASSVDSDCRIEGNASSDVQIGNVGSDVTVIGAARVQLGNVGSDCVLRDVQGDVAVAQVGSDLTLTGVGGNLRVGNIGSDAQLKGMHGSIMVGNIGSDLYLQADFPPESITHLYVGSDATIVLPDNANLRLNATAGRRISGRSIVSTFYGNVASLVYGEGAAQLDLHVGSDLTIRSGIAPRSSSSSGSASSSWESWGQDFGRQWSDFGREMERLGRDLGREINDTVSEATSSIGADIASDFSRSARGRVRHVHQRAEEEIRRAEEKARHASERAARFNIRIHDREWHMDSDRLQRIIDQARRAADEGILGALEAVEQALSNLHIQTPPRPAAPTPPTPPPAPGTPPTPPPAPGAPPTPEGGDSSSIREVDVTVSPTSPLADNEEQISPDHGESRPSNFNLEQERMAILRMIAEGRITPEEGDLLLEALGG